MKVNQDTEFTSDTIVGSGGILYALANKTTRTEEDGRISYEADVIAIDKVEDAAKAVRAFLINSIIITTVAGNTFDGNDAAMLNMSVAIQSYDVLGITTTFWKLADNTIKEVGIVEIKEALALSIQAKGLIVLGA